MTAPGMKFRVCPLTGNNVKTRHLTIDQNQAATLLRYTRECLRIRFQLLCFGHKTTITVVEISLSMVGILYQNFHTVPSRPHS